jgi:hypothetical protein
MALCVKYNPFIISGPLFGSFAPEDSTIKGH